MIGRQIMGTYPTGNVVKPPQEVRDIWSSHLSSFQHTLSRFIQPPLSQPAPHHPAWEDVRPRSPLPPLERKAVRSSTSGTPSYPGAGDCLFGWDPGSAQNEFGREERGSRRTSFFAQRSHRHRSYAGETEVREDGLGGVKSVMVVFGWEHVNYAIRSFVRVGGPTALMSSCAMLRLRRYLIPLIQRLHSGERRGGLMLGTGGISKLTRRNRSTSPRFSGYSVRFPVNDIQA
jgi:hypothetical protein